MGRGRSYLFKVESPNPEEVSPFLGSSSSLFDRFIGDGRSYFPFGQPCAEPAFHFSADIPKGGISPQIASFLGILLQVKQLGRKILEVDVFPFSGPDHEGPTAVRSEAKLQPRFSPCIIHFTEDGIPPLMRSRSS